MLQNPTALDLMAALEAAVIPATSANEHGVFTDPFALDIAFGKTKGRTHVTLLLAQDAETQHWAAAYRHTEGGSQPHVSELQPLWEQALREAIRAFLAYAATNASLLHESGKTALTALMQELETEIRKTTQTEESPQEYTDDAGRRWVPLTQLEINPALKIVPMLGQVSQQLMGSSNADSRTTGVEMSEERTAFWTTLDEQGILEDLKVHREGETLLVDDGRHRLEWAWARGKTHVPVREVSKEQGEALAEATVIGRRHWTKGQRAYLGVLLHPEVAGGEKRGGDRKSKKKAEEPELTARELAERVGVSADTMEQAIKLYTLFHAPEAKEGSPEAIEAADLKATFEVSIWGGAGLGGVLAGIGGGKVTKDAPKPASTFASLDKPLATLTNLSKSWTKWDEAERNKALKLITTRLKELDTNFRLALSEALSAAEA